ncbi:MAG TPA: efflux RND transporter permease subunit [Acidobacteriota bacterium]|nr:efflux RND transporter permease subunit [Acidobacteriota bacterium]
MNKTIAWFAKNTVAANLLMLVIVIGGIVSLTQVTQEVFPEFSADMITITVPYLGAAPEEVEEGVCVKIEEQVQSLEGVKEITSQASEGVGVVTIEAQPDFDIRELLDDVKNRVDAIDTFPEETEKPIIQEVIRRRQVINVAVSGQVDEMTLRRKAEQVRDELTALDGITQVQLSAARPYEVSIEVSERELRRLGLTFEQVAQAVRASSLDLPGGSVETQGGEILLRTEGQAYRRDEFRRLPLIARPDGTYIRLGEVAEVIDGFEDTDQSARFDGRPTILVQVFRIGDQSALEVSETVKKYVQSAQERMPPGIFLTTWQDEAKVLRGRLDLLLRNGWMGLMLVIIILALFLRLRLAFWVSLGIPMSFMGTLWLMPGLDVTINLMSLFAFIVVLGILVDDAIVVGEGVFSRQEDGEPGVQASIAGAQAVSTPVIFGVLTTVAAFSPLIFVEGTMGKVMAVIPLIVVPSLLFSLVESLLVLPAHLSHFKPPRKDESKPPGRLKRALLGFQNAFAEGLKWWTRKVYAPSLEFAIRWRYLTLSVGVATLVITVGLVAGGRIKFIFLPEVEADNVAAFLIMPQGTPTETTAAAVRRLEQSALETARELERRRRERGSEEERTSWGWMPTWLQASPSTKDPDAPVSESELLGGEGVFRHLLASIGDQPFRSDQSQHGGGQAQSFSGSHLGEVNIQLAPSEEREISSTEIAQMWREKTGAIADAVELTFTSSLFSPGEAVNVQLMSQDLEVLQKASAELKGHLGTYPGVFDITDSFRRGKQELELSIKPTAEMQGLSLVDLGRQVRQGFFGEEAQRIQRGRDEVKVMVRYPERERQSLGDVEDMRIRMPDGAEMAFHDVARARYGRGFSSIRRVDRQRAINVTADVDEAKITANEIVADLRSHFLPELMQSYPNLHYQFEGRQREQMDTLAGLGRGYIIAIIAIFALLAVPLRSYIQPLIIMAAIPFGVVGAIWGHVVMGLNLTILSLFGVVALAGVVVNDSLVMVDFINKRNATMPLMDAVRRAGIQRSRPILLTSLTTFGGLTPLLLEKSLQARFLIPMAVSLAFGVIFSTFVILVLVPTSYAILEDLHRLYAGPDASPDVDS